MTQCFCGCGKRVKPGQRAINARGEQIYQRWRDANRALNAVAGRSDTLWRFLTEGILIMDQLAEVVHGGPDPGRGLEAMSRDWQRQGRVIASDPLSVVADASGRDGLTLAETLRKLASHDFRDDLFAFTVEARRYPPPLEVLDPVVAEVRRDLAARKAATDRMASPASRQPRTTQDRVPFFLIRESRRRLSARR